MGLLFRAKKMINKGQLSHSVINTSKNTTFKKFRKALALMMFAGFVSIVSIILWEKATFEENVQHGRDQTYVSVDTLSSAYSQFTVPGATWRFDTTRWKQVDVHPLLWRYDDTNDIGIELKTYPSEFYDAMSLPDLIMNEVRKDKPEALFVGHEFIYKNGLVGVQLIYDAQHNSERQRYVGEYFSTPTHRVSLVAFTSLSKYPSNVHYIKQGLLGLQPLRSPQEVNESFRWMKVVANDEVSAVYDVNNENVHKEDQGQQTSGLHSAAGITSGTLPALIDPMIWAVGASDDLLLPYALSHKKTSGMLKRGVRELAQSVSGFAEGYRLVLKEDGATIGYTDDDVTNSGYLLITFNNNRDRVPLTRMVLLFPHQQGVFICHFETLTTLFDDAKEEAKTACTILANQE